MRSTGSLGYALSGFTFVALLTACSGGGTSAPARPVSLGLPAAQLTQSTSLLRFESGKARRPDDSIGFAEPDASGKAAFVGSDAYTNDVNVYTGAGKLIATITGFSEPQGLGADPQGDIYVANTAGSNILKYKNDYKTLDATFADPGQYPASVGFYPKTGMLGVSNILTTSGGAGDVSLYAKGTTKPCVTVANRSWSRVHFGAFDAAGDFFVDGLDSAGNVLFGVVRGGCSAVAITTIKMSNRIGFPGIVLVSTADKLVIGDQDSGTIYTFKVPPGNVLGPPIAKTVLKGGAGLAALDLAANGKDIWTLTSPDAVEYAYPAGGSPVKTVGLGDLTSLLIVPVAQP